MRILLFILTCLALAACTDSADDEAIKVAFIGSSSGLNENGVRLSVTGQHLRGATAQGLVRMDAFGQIVPGLAERWIVTDDGSSYIFRLREQDWPDGTPMTAQSVQRELTRTINSLDQTSLGLDLAVVDEVRGMAARVVEVRLIRPMPEFLQLLAQPELGLRHNNSGAGPMRFADRGDNAVLPESDTEADASVGSGLRIFAIAPEDRGLPKQTDWQKITRPIDVRTTDARQAINIFAEGGLDAVFNGRLATLPYVDTGPLARGTIRLDAAIGLFGLDIRNERSFLASRDNREAINMAIDRETLLAPFNIGGWEATNRITRFANNSAGNAQDGAAQAPWFALPMDARIATARNRVRQWLDSNASTSVRLTIALPEGPGSELLLRELQEDLSAVGIDLVLADSRAGADLTLRDRVARFDGQRWYLNQFNCAYSAALCDAEADALVTRAVSEPDEAQRDILLDQAEAILTDRNGYIPLGPPIRWSLLRGNIDGFAENMWAVHPLFPLSGAPI